MLARNWHIEMASVFLKRWTPLFDPKREQIGARPIWVRLPRLPLQFWSEEVFVKIGNTLGTFLDFDKSYVQTKNRTLAHILVHLDTREGLKEKITLKWRHYTWVQILDYEGIPFCCRRCHKVGHIFKECPLIKKSSYSPSTPLSSKGKAVSTLACTPVSVPRAPNRVGTSMAAEGVNRSPSPPMTQSHVVVAAEAERNASTPLHSHPISSISLSYSASLDSASIRIIAPSIPCALTSTPPIISTCSIFSASPHFPSHPPRID